MKRSSAWLAAASALGASPRFYMGTPEKYPGQRQAFRNGAWKGDGVPADPNRSKGRKCKQD